MANFLMSMKIYFIDKFVRHVDPINRSPSHVDVFVVHRHELP